MKLVNNSQLLNYFKMFVYKLCKNLSYYLCYWDENYKKKLEHLLNIIMKRFFLSFIFKYVHLIIPNMNMFVNVLLDN